jgi:hypothetical protein
MKQLRKAFKKSDRVFFHGCYNIPADPLISDKERVKMTAQDVWKVTGYRFRYEKLKVMEKKFDIHEQGQESHRLKKWPQNEVLVLSGQG